RFHARQSTAFWRYPCVQIAAPSHVPCPCIRRCTFWRFRALVLQYTTLGSFAGKIISKMPKMESRFPNCFTFEWAIPSPNSHLMRAGLTERHAYLFRVAMGRHNAAPPIHHLETKR